MSRLIFVLILGCATSPYAMTPAQVRNSYNTCMSFLKASAKQQATMASRSGYSLDQVRWACELQRDQGLQQMQWCEIRYQTGHRYCN